MPEPTGLELFLQDNPDLVGQDPRLLGEYVHQTYLPHVDKEEFFTGFLGPETPLERINQFSGAVVKGAANTLLGVPKAAVDIGNAVVNTVISPFTDMRLSYDPQTDLLMRGLNAPKQALEAVNPSDPRQPLLEGVGQGVGQIGTMIAAPTALASIPKLTSMFGSSQALTTMQQFERMQKAAIAGLGITMGVDEATQDAQMHGASPDQMTGAVATGIASGLTESLPIFSLLDRYAGGATGSRLWNTLKNGGIQAFQEALQETGQQSLINLYASSSYDKQRSMLEELEQSYQVGGIVGGIAGMIAGAVMPRHANLQAVTAASLSKLLGKEKAKEVIAQAEKMNKMTITELPNAFEAAKQGWEFGPFGAEETTVYTELQKAKKAALATGANVVKVGENFFLGRQGENPTEVDPYVAGQKRQEIPTQPIDGTSTTSPTLETYRTYLKGQYLAAGQEQGFTPEQIDEHVDLSVKLIRAMSLSVGMHPDDFVAQTLLTSHPTTMGPSKTIQGSTDATDGTPQQEVSAEVPTETVENAARGSYAAFNNLRGLIKITKSADFGTMVHELAHHFQRFLPAEDQNILAEVYGLSRPKNDTEARLNESVFPFGTDYYWSNPGREKFAVNFERYIRDGGRTRQKSMIPIFEKFRKWLVAIYNTLKAAGSDNRSGIKLDFELDPRVEAIFEKMLTPLGIATKLQPHEMSFDFFVAVYGNMLAAQSGVTDMVGTVPTPDLLSTKMDEITKKAGYMPVEEATTHIAMVNDPAYLSAQVMQKLDPVTAISRLVHYTLVNSSIAYHSGDVSTLTNIKQRFDKIANSWLDQNGEYNNPQLSKDLRNTQNLLNSQLEALEELAYFKNTPTRQFLIDLNEATGRQHLVRRDDGTVWRVDGFQGNNVVLRQHQALTEIDPTIVPKHKLMQDYVSSELIDPYDGEYITKEQWMLEQHYMYVAFAIKNGEQVPAAALLPHLNRDPMFQQLYDRAVQEERAKLAEPMTLEELRTPQVPDTMTKAAHVDPFVRFVDEAEVLQDATPDTQEFAQRYPRMVNELSLMYNQLINALMHKSGPKVKHIIAPIDIKKLSKLRVKEGKTLTIHDYFAHLLGEVDQFQNMLENNMAEINTNVMLKLTMAARIEEMHKITSEWVHRFYASNNEDLLLEPSPEEERINQVWRAMRYKSFGVLPEEETKAFWNWWKGWHTMHWIARRFPVMRQLVEAGGYQRLKRASEITMTMLNGGEVPEHTRTYKGKDGSDQVITIRNPGLRTFKSIKSGSREYQQLYNLLWGGDLAEVEFTDEQILSGQAVDPFGNPVDLSGLTNEEKANVLTAYHEVRDTNNFLFFYIHDILVETYSSDFAKKLAKKIFPEGFIPGYMPHERPGEFGFRIANSQGETIFFGTYDDRKQRNAVMEQRKRNLPEGFKIHIVDPQSPRLPGKFDPQALINAINNVIEASKISEIIGEAEKTRKVEAALDDALDKILRQHGLLRLTIPRSEKNIAGFDDRLQHVMFNRIKNVAATISKMEFARTASQELSRIHSAIPYMSDKAEEWVRTQMANSTQADMLADKIRALMFFRYLGFNVKTALVVFLDKITNAPAVLGMYTKGADKRLMEAMPKTVKWRLWYHRVAQPLMDQGASFGAIVESLTEEQVKAVGISKAAMMALHEQAMGGATSAKFTQELTALQELGMEVGWGAGRMEASTGSSIYSKTTDYMSLVLGNAFRFSSKLIEIMEGFNRESTYLAAFEALQEKEDNYDRNSALAAHIVNTAHFMYGKPNMPLTVSNRMKLLRPVMTFRTFEMNYVQLIGELMRHGGKGKLMAARSLLTLAALGGGMALPFLSTIVALAGWATGDDWEQEVKVALEKMDPSEFLATLWTDGVPGLANVTLRNSLQVGAYKTLEEVALGPVGGMARDIKGVAEGISMGDFDAAYKLVVPVAMTNAWKAVDGGKQYTENGTPLRDTNLQQIVLTPAERAMKLASFQPQRVAETWRVKQALDTEASYYSRWRNRIGNELEKAIRKNDPELLQSALADMREYNQEAMTEAVGIPPMQDVRSLLRERGLQNSEIIRMLRLTGHLGGTVAPQ